MDKKQKLTRSEYAGLREAVIALYARGHNEARIPSNVELLSEIGPSTPEHQRVEIERLYGFRLNLGKLWKSINQRTVNSWLQEARKRDSDLEIHHVLAKRNFNPGMHTNWQPTGPFHIGSHYDPITDTLLLGPGVSTKLGSRGVIRNIYKSKEATSEEDHWRKTREHRAIIISELKNEYECSYRDIEKLSKGQSTRHPERDILPRVKHIRENLPRVS